jgi:lysophospholipase L1-like esterase
MPILKPRNNPAEYLKKKNNSQASKGKKTVLCIGDSITHGLVSGNYVKLLEKRLSNDGYEFINAGINSELAYNIWNRIEEIIQCQPDIITILIGTNDTNRSFHPGEGIKVMKSMHLPALPTIDEYQKYLQKFVAKLKNETHAKIAILSLPTIGENIEKDTPIEVYTLKFCEVIKAIAKKFSLTYIPLNEKIHEYLTNNPTKIHPPVENWQKLTIKAIIKVLVFNKSLESISENLKQQLHSDLLHLNMIGAEMVANLLEGFIKSADS